MKTFGSILVASICLHAAMLAGYANSPVLSAVLCLAAGVIVFKNVIIAGGGLRRRVSFRDALATIIILSGILRFFFNTSGDSDQAPAPNLKSASKSSTAQNAASTSLDNSGDHTGVILLPEKQQHVTLIPPLPSMPSDLFDAKHQNPVTIPFYGAYWFFKLPDTRPPPGSYVTHGKPTEMTFHAPDRRPLIMEAHQNLGKLIDLACCSEIRIEVENADHYLGTVSIELILVNTREGQKGSVSLGRAPITSVPNVLDRNPSLPVKETLTFPIPSRPSIRQFDELTILFPRQKTRIDRSARIAIDRLVLVPRA